MESLATASASRIAKSTAVRTPELRRLCPLFADRAQDGDRQTRSDVVMAGVMDCGQRADIAISTRVDAKAKSSKKPVMPGTVNALASG